MDNIFPYIKENCIYYGENNRIERPSILVVSGKLVQWGSYGYLKYRSEIEKKKLISNGISAMEVELVPLYESLDLESCLKVFKIVILGVKSFEGSEENYKKFLRDICKMSSRRKSFNEWVKGYRVSNPAV